MIINRVIENLLLCIIDGYHQTNSDTLFGIQYFLDIDNLIDSSTHYFAWPGGWRESAMIGPQWTNTHQRTIHWMFVNTQLLWMNLTT
jgi:hypothetical protein